MAELAAHLLTEETKREPEQIHIPKPILKPDNSYPVPVYSSFKEQETGTGRAPWYIRSKTTYIVGVGGGTASGKTSVCREVMKRLKLPWVQILSMDNFYKGLGPNDDPSDYNFDHPDAFDWKLIIRTIQDFKDGFAVQIPEYDFTTHSRLHETTVMYGADVLLFEGILTLHNDELCKYLDLKVFVTEEDDIRLIRRIRRDMKERQRTLESVLSQYQKTVKPSYDLFCAPTQRKAHIIIPRGKSNTAAIDILATHIQKRVQERGLGEDKFHQSQNDIGSFSNIRQLGLTEEMEAAFDRILSEDCQGEELLKETNAITIPLVEFARGLAHSPSQQISYETDEDPNQSQSKPKAIRMYGPQVRTTLPVVSARLKPGRRKAAREATGTTLAKKRNVEEDSSSSTTDNDHRYLQRIETRKLLVNTKSPTPDPDTPIALTPSTGLNKTFCSVLITYGGYIMESAIHHVFHGEDTLSYMTSKDPKDASALKDISLQGTNRNGLGTIRVSQVEGGKMPRFYYRELPLKIAKRKVILADCLIDTGNRARMALHVLLDHHVKEKNVCLVSLVAKEKGLASLARRFKDVIFVTGKVVKDSPQHLTKVKGIRSLVSRYCDAAKVSNFVPTCSMDTFDT